MAPSGVNQPFGIHGSIRGDGVTEDHRKFGRIRLTNITRCTLVKTLTLGSGD